MDLPESPVNEILRCFEPLRENAIPILHAVQEKEGFLSADNMREVAEYLSLSRSEIYGIATFYTRFKFKPSGKHCLKVCRGTACHVKGAGEVLAEFEKRLGIKPGESTPDGEYFLETEACFGSCALAPVVVADEHVHGRMTPSRAGDILRNRE